MPYVTVSEAWIKANVSSRWQVKRGDPLYHAGIDVNRDGIIDITDLQWFASRIGERVYVPDVDAKFFVRFYKAPWVSYEEIVNSISSGFEEFKSQPPSSEELEEWRMLGDVNRDGLINQVDLDIISAAFDSKLGDANWNPDADVNNDGVVSILDLKLCGMNQGRDLNLERQSITVDYPLEFRGGSWWCEELEITVYGSPIGPVVAGIIIGALAIAVAILGYVVLQQWWENVALKQTLVEVRILVEEAIAETEELERMIRDSDLPQEEKDKLLDQTQTIIDKMKEARDKADKAGRSGDWMDWFWQLFEWAPIIIGALVVGAIAVPLISALAAPPRR